MPTKNKKKNNLGDLTNSENLSNENDKKYKNKNLKILFH